MNELADRGMFEYRKFDATGRIIGKEKRILLFDHARLE